MSTTNTQWVRVYRPRFYLKYMALQEGSDKKNIKDYTLKMANHPDPSNIGGCESCPSGDSLKIVFNTGWAIVYQVLESEIHFLEFYRHIPSY